MEICASRDAFAHALDTGGSPECGFELLEIGKAGLRRGIHAKQSSKCSAVYRTNCGMVRDRKNQGFNVAAPTSFLFQVETARFRPNGLTRRTVSQATTSPISHAMFNNPSRATIAIVKAPAPPRKGVAANNASSYVP